MLELHAAKSHEKSHIVLNLIRVMYHPAESARSEAQAHSPIAMVTNLVGFSRTRTRVPCRKMTLAEIDELEGAANRLAQRLRACRESRRKAVPDGFRCSITQEVMRDPVIVYESGHTYERAAIERWFEEHSTDPKTNIQLTRKDIIPNHGLRSTIQEFLSA